VIEHLAKKRSVRLPQGLHDETTKLSHAEVRVSNARQKCHTLADGRSVRRSYLARPSDGSLEIDARSIPNSRPWREDVLKIVSPEKSAKKTAM